LLKAIIVVKQNGNGHYQHKPFGNFDYIKFIDI